MNITQRALILTLLICTLFSVTSYGNGGPVNESYFYQTGNIRFLNEPRIKVTQEDLFIKIVDDYCEVTVKYVFEGDFNGKVLYGFPVDYWIFRDYYENGIEPEISLDSKNEQFDQDYIKDFKIEWGGEVISYITKTDSITFYGEEQVNGYMVGPFNRYARKWHLSELFFTEDNEWHNEPEKELIITYKVATQHEDSETNKSPMVYYSPRIFRYDLSPASSWGKGMIDNFNLEIDVRDLMNYNDTIVWKINGIQGVEFKDSICSISASDFNLAQNSMLTIEYLVNDTSKINHRMKNPIKPINSYCTNPTSSYPTSNLTDGDIRTAWADGQKNSYGIGDTIVFVLNEKNTYYLDKFLVLNGYYKNKETYYNNARLKEVKVIYNIYRDYKNTLHSESEYVSFDDFKYEELKEYNILKKCTNLLNRNEGVSSKKIMLIIHDVYPGKKYKDVCISEVYILGRKGI